MTHILDNPVWNALETGNNTLANGNNTAKYFDSEVSPFVALRNIDAACFNSLHKLITHNNIIILAWPDAIDIPTNWDVIAVAKGYQMVYTSPPGEIQLLDLPLTDLSIQHVSDMMVLTKLTNPGPFAPRTLAFGHYQGIWHNHQLVAMAGQRMQPYNYAEISAVCTHHYHAGKGYARQLISAQIIRMQAAGLTPFLHVRHDNERALKLYEQLGFAVRSEIHFHIFKKR